MSIKRVLITGVTGQDGSYLAELLISKGYEVHAIRRRTSLFNASRIDNYISGDSNQPGKISLHYADMADSASLYKIIEDIKPREVYNLAAQTHVGVSFDVPEYTGDITGLGVVRMLEALRHVSPNTKFYQASSSEMFGKVLETPQKETTPFYPMSPYGIAKVFAYWTTKNYRESYDMFTCNGILFNHESPKRGRTFVTRKITRAVARILHKKQDKIFLGNLNASRDWGHAKDYVEAMWLMMQQHSGDDYVISSNETHTIREFVQAAFKEVDIDIAWKGEGLNECGYDTKTNREYVVVDPIYFRPSEVEFLLGDSTKARTQLGWAPKYSFKDLVKEMVAFDVENEGRDSGYLNY